MSAICLTDDCCFNSSVKNISGATIVVTYLGPRGVTLAANEIVTVPGDVRQTVQARGNRDYTAFLGDVFTRKAIDILHTPNPILYDKAAAEPVMVRVNNGTLAAVDVCWNNTLNSF